VLAGHCQAVGRDLATLQKQLVILAIVRPDSAAVDAELRRFAQERQVPLEAARQMAIAGTPDEVAAQLAAYRDLGFGMFLLMERRLPDYATLELFMQAVVPKLRAA
jgi:alkanesulfonate monooxygenase SsuD/methylene tetrahydromethanopterin reductase-like flavin-dependent oxidoreductase (luciferase family)